MSSMTNPKFFELALQTGGSHYPDVGGKLLEQYSVNLLNQILQMCQDHPTWSGRAIGEHIKQEFML